MDIKFRDLEADEIECRIGQVSKQGTGLSLLLYKTARTDARILDETVGPTNWANDFKSIDGKLFCGIGVKDGEDWVWKWDTGTESNMEAQKGEASDSFKRAGFKWGIGVALYDTPFIWVPSDKCNLSNGKCFDKFSVAKVKYNLDGHITGLAIRNDKTGKIVFIHNEEEK